MKYRELSEKLLDAYRQYPKMPATLGELRRGALRGVIGNLASVHHLKATISGLTSDGYKSNSPLMATMRTRLQDAEAALLHYERVLYDGKQQEERT